MACNLLSNSQLKPWKCREIAKVAKIWLNFSKLFKMCPTCILCIASLLKHFANSCSSTTKLTRDGATEQLCLREIKMVEKKARIVCQCSFLDSELRKSRFAARGGCLRARKDWMRDLKGTLEQVPRLGVKILDFPARTQLINFAQWRYTNQWSYREVVLLLVENWYQYPGWSLWKIKG